MHSLPPMFTGSSHSTEGKAAIKRGSFTEVSGNKPAHKKAILGASADFVWPEWQWWCEIEAADEGKSF